MLSDLLSKRLQRLELRFVETLALYQRDTLRIANVQRAIVPADAGCASGKNRIFIPFTTRVESEFE
jgi:hypothetical protein